MHNALLALFANAATATAAPPPQTADVAATAAAQNAPLFGNQWLALGVILLGVAAFTVLVGLFGRYLAATHPDPKPPASGTTK